MMVVSFCLFGCMPSHNVIVRYQSVPIPTYDRRDYEELLTSKDHDVKYNAICNLIPYAFMYARILDNGMPEESSGTTPEDEAISYDTAQQVFDVIRLGLQSHNENIKVASLIFLSEFSRTYSDKYALFALVSQVNTHDVKTQYEQIRALLPLVDTETEIEKPLIQDFLNSQSWLIRSMTYRLLGEILCEEFHPRLLRDYRKTTREYDKLLIVYAFRHQYGPEVFTLLTEELLWSTFLRIQMAIVDILPGNQENTAVGTWLVGHYHQLNEDVLTRMINQYASELFRSDETTFFDSVLEANQPQLLRLIAQSRFFEVLYTSLEHENQSHDLIDLRDAVQYNNVVNEAWKAYKDERDQERLKEEEEAKREEALRKAILPQYTDMLETFLAESTQLFTDAGMTAEEIEETTEDIREFLQIFQDDQAKEPCVQNCSDIPRTQQEQ